MHCIVKCCLCERFKCGFSQVGKDYDADFGELIFCAVGTENLIDGDTLFLNILTHFDAAIPDKMDLCLKSCVSEKCVI